MIIFDLDGTLWDSTVQVAESWNIKIEQTTGRKDMLRPCDISRNMGLTMNQIADNLFADLDEDKRYELARVCETYENDYIRRNGANLYPSIRETLAKLHAAGETMAVVSNCQEGYIPAFMESMNMGGFFVDYEEWGRTGLSKAENIRLVMERNKSERAVYVGDIQGDADAAHEAGIACIWASYGFGEIDDADGEIECFDELPSVLKAMGYLDERTEA